MIYRIIYSETLTGSDVFINMPLSTQALYFHLYTRSGDEGLLDNVRAIQKMINAKDIDLEILISNQLIERVECSES